MAVQKRQPSESFRNVYEELGTLLDDGDDAFIEEGPGIVQDALDDPTFLDGIETEHATDSYTRAKAMGRPGEHVIRFMEWPPEFSLMPHEHHGRPCFEVLVDGTLFLASMDVEPIEDDRYEMSPRGTTVCKPGDAGVVDPRNGSDVHSVYSTIRTRSLHFYPDDNYSGFGYVLDEDDDSGRDLYERREFTLRERD